MTSPMTSPTTSPTTSDSATVEWTDGARPSQRTPWRGALSRTEIGGLLELHDARSWLSLAADWGLVFASFAVVAAWPNPLTIVAALFVIGARQLGLAVLMHEAAHRTLLRDRRWNDAVGSWLCAFPVWSDLRTYRRYHLQHHAKNWTAEDPDLDLATKFPVTPASMRRKIWRDLSGQVAWKRVKAILRRDLGGAAGKTRRDDHASFGKTAGLPGWRNLRGMFKVLRDNKNLVLFCDGGYRRGDVPVELCGEPTTLPIGPATLAAKTGAPMLTVACRRATT